MTRRLPVGAEIGADGAHFRVWAPTHRQVTLVFEGAGGTALREVALESEPGGYFAGTVSDAPAGTRYRYRLGTHPDLVPDPASRFQPDGPHGPSALVDAAAFSWTDAAWPGVTLAGQVLYELHVGTFTEDGTWRAATERLPALADLGITVIEVMPLADFPGKRGWGYDGVNLFAPTRLYGTPDDVRAFVDRAHALGLGVILDVVFNHFGPDGNYLARFSPAYFTSRHANEWGEAINYDEDAEPIRALMTSNAAYWIAEFHLDGLRLDATQQIFDDSPVHLIAEIVQAARAAAGQRSIIVVAENEPQDTRLLAATERGGYGLDALWNDDFHHAAVVALTGRREAYYTDYQGSPQELISLAKYGFLYQGQRYSWQRARRGTPSLGIAPERFITFLENHDQVANDPSGRGLRLRDLTDAACYRAMTAYWLLAPGTPMFFQGQEYGSTGPFRYFTDHRDELAAAVRRGRAEFLSQFRSTPEDLVDMLPDPSDPLTFADCRLSHEPNASAVALHRDLLRLRRDERVFGLQRADCIEASVLGPQTFVLRYFPAPIFGSEAEVSGRPAEAGRHVLDGRHVRQAMAERLVVVNLGIDLHLDPAPHPLLAPPAGTLWRIQWSSEDPAYGGRGTAPLDTDDNWLIPGRATVVLVPEPL